MSEMTPEMLRWCAHIMRDLGRLVYAAQIEDCASAWEAARVQHITDMAYIEATDETIAELRARIETLEKEVKKSEEVIRGILAWIPEEDWPTPCWEGTRAFLAERAAREDEA